MTKLSALSGTFGTVSVKKEYNTLLLDMKSQWIKEPKILDDFKAKYHTTIKAVGGKW